MKKGKRAFAVLALAITCITGSLGEAGAVFAEEALRAEGEAKGSKTYTYGDWEYYIKDDGTVFITLCRNSDTVVEIPPEIDGRVVSGFAKDGYPDEDDGDFNATTLIIPETVTYINTNARSYGGLEEIIVKEGNQAYRSLDGVVYDKQMKTLIWCPEGKRGVLTVPEGVEVIGENGCMYSGLSGIRLPCSLREIGEYAFEECRFTGIDIPETVEKIERGAFAGCEELKKVYLPQGIKNISDRLFLDCENLSSVRLPEGAAIIGEAAFQYCLKLKSIKLPRKLESIGKSAFSGCHGLESIVIPEGTTSIGKFAFAFCSNLENIRLPGSVKKIGTWAFYKSDKITIECIDKSYAKSCAIKRGIPYRIVKKVPAGRLGLTVNAQSVKDGQTLKVKVKKSYTVQAVRAGAREEVKWKTSNAKVASVKNGKVSVKKAGKATITATASDGKKARIKLAASKAAVPVSKVQISGSKTMKKGGKQILGLTVTPATADSTKVSWKSSDKKIAMVDKNGKVVVKKKGSVVITATAKDGSKKKGNIVIKVK